jgi:hypothetical protein
MQIGNTPFERSHVNSHVLGANLVMSWGLNTQIHMLMREELELVIQGNGAPGYYEAASLSQRWNEIFRLSVGEA